MRLDLKNKEELCGRIKSINKRKNNLNQSSSNNQRIKLLNSPKKKKLEKIYLKPHSNSFNRNKHFHKKGLERS